MELFEIDDQTLSDLEIFESSGKGRSLFSLFDLTSTLGGREKLLDIFNQPLVDPAMIKDRQKLLIGLEHLTVKLDINKQSLDLIAYFMAQRDNVKSFTVYRALKDFLLFRSTQAYYIKQRGVHEILDLIILLNETCLSMDLEKSPLLIQHLADALTDLINEPVIKRAMETRPGPLSILNLARCNELFRKSLLKKIKHILDLVYQLDAFIAVSNAAKLYGLCYPALRADTQKPLEIKGVFHLFLEQPITNDLEFNVEKNVCFITGSNMAGKSTLLKSAAICIYLAHLGFPVPAESMSFSVFYGLMTTINLSDNLNQGYSHFYNEVMRVKEVAVKVNANKPMVVIFDELFRGTNVKDAYDGSLAIVKAFSAIKDSFFMISTHIVEVATELIDHPGIDFNYMETNMKTGKPAFSYQLKKGITEERMGMWIIENEGIVEILKLKSERK